MAARLGVRVRQSGEEIPTALQSLSEAYVAGNAAVARLTTQPGESLTIPATSTFIWYFDLARLDGRSFTAGTYRLDSQLNGAESAIRDEHGNAWRGRGPQGFMRFEVTVIRPSRPSEVAAMHIAAAREFMSRLRDEDALAKIQAAVAADPTSAVARQYLGGLYNVLKRPNDASPFSNSW